MVSQLITLNEVIQSYFSGWRIINSRTFLIPVPLPSNYSHACCNFDLLMLNLQLDTNVWYLERTLCRAKGIRVRVSPSVLFRLTPSLGLRLRMQYENFVLLAHVQNVAFCFDFCYYLYDCSCCYRVISTCCLLDVCAKFLWRFFNDFWTIWMI